MGLKVAIPNTQASTFTGGTITGATTFDDVVLLSDGSAAAPALAFSAANSADNGIFRRSGDYVMFAAAGAEQGYIISDGTYGLAIRGGVGMAAGETAGNSVDTAIVRSAAAVVRVSTGGAGTGSLLSTQLVEPNTAGTASPNILTAAESGTVLTNEGATAENYHTLPTAAAGLTFTFVVQDADGLRVVANTDDTIRIIDSATAAAGYISSTTIGSAVTLVAINAVQWIATSVCGVWTNGTWTYDDTGLTT